jgi:hypothetical protein
MKTLFLPFAELRLTPLPAGPTSPEPARAGALFSEDRLYRYHLWRTFSEVGLDRIVVVMLNPSLADDDRDDPTVARLSERCRRWGYGRLDVVNLYALISPKPAALLRHPDPVGPENDRYIREVVAGASRLLVAWGSSLPNVERSRAVLSLLRQIPDKPPVECLGCNEDKQPTHPLFLSYDVKPRAYVFRP